MGGGDWLDFLSKDDNLPSYVRPRLNLASRRVLRPRALAMRKANELNELEALTGKGASATRRTCFHADATVHEVKSDVRWGGSEPAASKGWRCST